jgi:hypothetical protein
VRAHALEHMPVTAPYVHLLELKTVWSHIHASGSLTKSKS